MISTRRTASVKSGRQSRTALAAQAASKVDSSSKDDVIVSPSILSANFATLGAEVRRKEGLGVTQSKPGISWGQGVGESLIEEE